MNKVGAQHGSLWLTTYHGPLETRTDRASTHTILCGVVEEHADDPLRMLGHLSLMNLMMVSTVCPEMKKCVDTFLEKTWLSMFPPFVDSPEAFIEILDTTSSVISGSFALWFLLGGALGWEPQDLDIYCPVYGGNKVVHYLKMFEGYFEESENVEDIEEDYERGRRNQLASINTIIHLTSPRGRRIDIVESTSPSALHPLPHTWTTILPNYVSARTLCVPYPYHVLCNFGSLACENSGSPATREEVAKYEGRGYTMYPFRSGISASVVRAYPSVLREGGCTENPYCPNMTRTFGDQWCLRYTFKEKRSEGLDGVGCLVPEWRLGGFCGWCEKETSTKVTLVAH